MSARDGNAGALVGVPVDNRHRSVCKYLLTPRAVASTCRHDSVEPDSMPCVSLEKNRTHDTGTVNLLRVLVSEYAHPDDN